MTLAVVRISYPQTIASTLTVFAWPPLTVAVFAPMTILSLNPCEVNISSLESKIVFPSTRLI